MAHPPLSLSCQCNKVTASIAPISPKVANHLVCYCRDCQQFAHALKRTDDVLNAYGGTEIVQVPIADFNVLDGEEHIACLKLSDKGLHRWYAKCCNTPIGNTLSASWPFIGVIRSFINDQALDEKAGTIKGSVHLKDATGLVPDELLGPQGHKRLMLATLVKLACWKLKQKHTPNCLFNKDGTPIVTPHIHQAH
ncbi:DUF6151 family protein [Pseudoalteromonas sp. T1lg23B]|uniref:DUF6151 family protein n=1 Tax=Pseudoalteromonas sp. T1lg23B TaxID=2077097 RepID=UPI000CF68C8B|nr:DUF6151 family protein [Pseudoalteromonas sp. T1lg23B]